MSSVLRPGGHVIISTPSRYRVSNLLRVVSGRRVNFISKLHVTEYTVGQVIEQLRFGGFDFVAHFDRSVQPRTRSLTHFVAFRVIKPILSALLRLIGSHHSLESTVFYLARKRWV
jgi:hypothetical protein